MRNGRRVTASQIPLYAEDRYISIAKDLRPHAPAVGNRPCLLFLCPGKTDASSGGHGEEILQIAFHIKLEGGCILIIRLQGIRDILTQFSAGSCSRQPEKYQPEAESFPQKRPLLLSIFYFFSILYPIPHTTFKYSGSFGFSSIFSRIRLICTITVFSGA